ncbi:MAG TPA: Ig-like domain-containing protein [Solirubrobacteraceae bacterium]|nr:Ig-like domain-containing protein [Solirubrobacteraceae bacterium]
MHILSRAGRLGLISTLAVAALCAGPAVGSALASGLVPTSTTVVASTDIIGPTDSATLTATVQLGLLITPTGSVTFTDVTNNTVLGSARLSSPCLLSLKQCKAHLTVIGAQLTGGENLIKATYAGDGLSKPSSGTTHLYAPENAGDDVTCGPDQFCQASDTSPDGTAALDVQAGPSSTGESVLIAFGTTPLTCSTPDTGDIGVFDVSDPTSADFVIFDSLGAAGAAAQAAHPIAADGSGGYVCFDAPTSFTTASGAPAAQQPDGSFQGVLAPCVPTAGAVANPPCYDGGSYTPNERGGTYETDVIVVPGPTQPSDPRIGH